ncbi:MAG: chromate resistance protein ChrB [Candidatus Dormibacteraeota bacterium]|nr:chromate resistance protein ChrB [Candidatus Dormibacteraeota bacterium]
MSQANIQRGHWLVLIYRLSADTSSARSAVWRETRRLGALSLQHGVCLLPLSESHREACSRLIERVEGYGGEAVVLETRSPSDAWEARTITRFNQARDEEYEEVVDEAERFREEIDRERRKGKYTFAELEDEETNLERLHKYIGQVEARDWFGASGRSRAAAEVATCEEVLQVFAQEIFERQAGSPEVAPPEPDQLSRWLVEERE